VSLPVNEAIRRNQTREQSVDGFGEIDLTESVRDKAN